MSFWGHIGRVARGGAEAAGHVANVFGNAAQLHEHATTPHPSRLRKAIEIGGAVIGTAIAVVEAVAAARKAVPKGRRTRP